MSSTSSCYHHIHDDVFNRCYSLPDSILIRNISKEVFYYFTPSILMACIVILQLILPFVFSSTSKANQSKAMRLYNVTRFFLLSLFHRITYAFSLVPWLSFWIKQPGPCSCTDLRVPTLNFPYQYTFSSVTCGMALFDFSSFNPVVLRILGSILLLVPSTVYVLSGWASLAQVLASGLFAIFLHYFHTLSTNLVALIENSGLLIANLITLFFTLAEDKVSKKKASPSIIHGIAALLYDTFLMIRFIQKNNWTFVNVSHESVVSETSGHRSLSSTLIDADETAAFSQRMTTDQIDSIFAFFVVIFIDGATYSAKS